MSLIDSDVLIDAQRNFPPAREWLAGFVGELSVPSPVAWELLIGSRNRLELREAQEFLAEFDVEEVESADSTLARSLIEDHCLSTGLSIPDFIIAAQALNRETTLFSFNLRHFRMIPGLDVQAPYTR